MYDVEEEADTILLWPYRKSFVLYNKGVLGVRKMAGSYWKSGGTGLPNLPRTRSGLAGEAPGLANLDSVSPNILNILNILNMLNQAPIFNI